MKKTLKLDREVVTTDYAGGSGLDDLVGGYTFGKAVDKITKWTKGYCYASAASLYVSYNLATEIASCNGCTPNCSGSCQASCLVTGCACFTQDINMAGCSGGTYC